MRFSLHALLVLALLVGPLNSFPAHASAPASFSHIASIDYDRDVPGHAPTTGGLNQPSFLWGATGALLVQSNANGIATQPLVITLPAPNGYASASYWMARQVASGDVRIEATVSFDRLLDGIFLESGGSNYAIVTRLNVGSNGTIYDDKSRTVVGRYVPRQPFRVRVNIDMTARTWSASIDNEFDGFADDPPVVNLLFGNPDWAIPDLRWVGQALYTFPTAADVLGGSVAYDDVDIDVSTVDTTPPTLHMPGEVVVDATGPAGAVVTYTITATDDFDSNPVVTCTPPSGSVFPIGTTTVLCTATDEAGNSTSGSFTVEVLGGARYDHVAIEFVTDWGGRVTHWEGDVATGTVMAMVNDGALEWLAADATYGDPAATLSMDLRSRHIGRLMTGSLTATRGNARIQFRNVITPFALAADGTITTPFPIPATISDGRGFVSGHLTLRFSND